MESFYNQSSDYQSSVSRTPIALSHVYFIVLCNQIALQVLSTIGIVLNVISVVFLTLTIISYLAIR